MSSCSSLSRIQFHVADMPPAGLMMVDTPSETRGHRLAVIDGDQPERAVRGPARRGELRITAQRALVGGRRAIHGWSKYHDDKSLSFVHPQVYPRRLWTLKPQTSPGKRRRHLRHCGPRQADAPGAWGRPS